jgi:hypothetical protein
VPLLPVDEPVAKGGKGAKADKADKADKAEKLEKSAPLAAPVGVPLAE